MRMNCHKLTTSARIGTVVMYFEYICVEGTRGSGCPSWTGAEATEAPFRAAGIGDQKLFGCTRIGDQNEAVERCEDQGSQI